MKTPVKILMAALGTLFISAIAFAVGGIFGFLLALSLHLHGPGEVAGIGGLFNGIAGGIFYGLILGLISGIVGGIWAIRLFKNH